MDAGSLDGRGIGGVDIGRDDQTTITRFAFTSYNLLETVNCLLITCYALLIAFKEKHFQNRFYHTK